jgi:hypothetical protein
VPGFVNVPVTLDEEKVTVPVGEYPVTLTVQTVGTPCPGEAGEQSIARELYCRTICPELEA